VVELTTGSREVPEKKENLRREEEDDDNNNVGFAVGSIEVPGSD
jgi:hypothetical protein